MHPLHPPCVRAYALYQRYVLSHRGVILSIWVCCSVIRVRWFSNFSETNYLGTTYLPVSTCRSLCFDLFNLVLSFLAFSVLASAFQRFTRKHCLQMTGLKMSGVA